MSMVPIFSPVLLHRLTSVNLMVSAGPWPSRLQAERRHTGAAWCLLSWELERIVSGEAEKVVMLPLLRQLVAFLWL